MVGENHLHIIEKGAVQEPTPYLDVLASEKTLYNIHYTLIKTKKFSIWEIGLKKFKYRCPETKYFILSRRTRWSKVSNAFWRSTNIMPGCICLSIPVEIRSVNWVRQKFIEWLVLKRDWYIWINFFPIKVVFSLKFYWFFNYLWYGRQKWNRWVVFGTSPCTFFEYRV